jgi:tetratricopeptide (TPR) repeat protein
VSYRSRIIKAYSRGDLVRAEALAGEFLASGGGGDALCLLGVVTAAKGQSEEALTLLTRAAELLPQRADVLYNRGVVLREAGRLAEAVADWRRAVSFDGSHRDAWRNLALALHELGDVGGSAEVYGTLLNRWPTDRDGIYNFANLCHRQHLFEGALSLQQTLVRNYPDFAAGWVNMGMTLKAMRRFDEAEACYRRAIDIEPDSALAHFDLSNLLLLQGRWAEGFGEYEWRLKLPDAPRPEWAVPPWTGAEPPGTRVVLWNDQGFGDAIQFLRYVPKLASSGYRVVTVLRRELVRLAASVPGIEAVFDPDGPAPEADVHLPLLSLPHRLGCTDPGGSLAAPYLSAAPADLPSPAGAKRVGLVWAGNPTHQNDAQRSTSLADLAPLLAVPGIAWFSLQVGPRTQELAASPWAAQLTDLAPSLTDFAVTASAVAALDLVIAVDTAVAHLTGAMGQPGWVMLPADCDWRWGASGQQSEWYPSLRLFRQAASPGWALVVAEMVARLAASC